MQIITLEWVNNMFCTNCGTKLEENVRFCGECGKPAADTFFASPPPQEHAEPTLPQPPDHTGLAHQPDDYQAEPAPQQYNYPEQPQPQAYGYTESPPPPPPPAHDYAEPPPPPPPPYYGTSQPPPPPVPQYYGHHQPEDYQQETSKKGILKIIIPVAAVAVLALVFVVLYFFTDTLPFGPSSSDGQEQAHFTGVHRDSPTSPAPTPTQRPARPTTPPVPVMPMPTSPVPASPVPNIESIQLPGAGGEVRLNGPTEISFTPETGGEWEIITSDNGSSDPLLEIYDARWNLIASDDDSAGGLNARLNVHLDAGATYNIAAGFWGNGTGAYTLTVSMSSSSIHSPIPGQTTDYTLPPGGGEVWVENRTVFSFTPEQSGHWVFRTQDNRNSDPYLELYDSRGGLIAYDDDGAGDFNAMMCVYLNAGETYFIEAIFYQGDFGSYTLTVSTAIPVPPEGADMHLTGPSVLSFTPNRGGIWEFETSNNGNSDPFLTIYDEHMRFLTNDDDSGQGLNALIATILDANTTYIIYAAFFDGVGSYDLSIRLTTR